ncbi:hypothetical protein FB451DRAFT_1137464 [Mycena latifolia]|nr:hypothetical protein FB451DRAFT_1137464 [Mycena latifolia]
MDFQKDPWPPYKPPRNIDSLDTLWLPSLDSFKRDGALYGDSRRDIVYPATHHTNGPDSGSPGRNFSRVFRALRRLISRSTEDKHREEGFIQIQRGKEIPQVQLSEWRAFAAYSRPTINGVNVHNTFTPSPTPYRNIDMNELDIDEVFASLRSPDGGIHPELWIPGIQHPSLPPPPTGWPLPHPGEPLAFPWECQLNPFLQHALCGPAPVYWNIRSGELAILYGGPLNVTIPLSPADLAQPATRPLLTHMYVSGLALSDVRFPWKFMVVNPAGIRVRDVFRAIMDNFQQLVFPAEWEKWGPARQQRAKLEWTMRGAEETQDGLRRIDYLCGQLFFRGLAPNPDRTGWVLFIGSEW